MKLVGFVVAVGGLVICAGATVGDPHPIVEVQSGYLFGAPANGKWLKADEAAKALPGETTYKVYGLTQSLGESNRGAHGRAGKRAHASAIK
jgi:hypothetical protein